MSNHAELRFVEANGLRFAYYEEGDGPLVLLLHGFPDTAHTWDDVRPALAQAGFRAVTPFMRGYAPSAIPAHDSDSETLGNDAIALIEALGGSGAKSAILVGHDWGASAAYSAAAISPEAVNLLVTIAIPHPATLKPSLAKLWGTRHFVAYKLPGAAARFAANNFAAMRAIYKRWSPAWTPPDAEFQAVREAFAQPGSLDAAFGYYRALSPRLPQCLRSAIEVPTVAFAGLDDGVAEPVDFQRAASQFTASYHVEEMPGGHFLHREHPTLFIERLLERLRAHSTPTAAATD